jgi:hypothetical protein
MRRARLKPQGMPLFYHIYNRVAGEPGYFPFGPAEKEHFERLLHKLNKLVHALSSAAVLNLVQSNTAEQASRHTVGRSLQAYPVGRQSGGLGMYQICRDEPRPCAYGFQSGRLPFQQLWCLACYRASPFRRQCPTGSPAAAGGQVPICIDPTAWRVTPQNLCRDGDRTSLSSNRLIA